MATVSYTNATLDEFTLGSDPDSNLTLSWIQELPYPGKRGLASDVARAQIDVAGTTLEAVRVDVLAAVKQGYAALHRLDRTTSILAESRKLLVSYRESARARYESGDGILENVLKAATELARLDAELATLAQERRASEVSLNALLGRSLDISIGPALTAPLLELPDAPAVEQAALARSPELQGLRALARREESRLELARRNLKPDLMWGASYANRGGLDPMVTGMFGVRLPLFRQKKQAEAVTQTQYELDAARRDVESREVGALSEVRDLLARAQRADGLVRLYSEGILPQARAALDAAAASYATGRAEFVTLIEDFRTVLDYEVGREVQGAEKTAALAALERLTGLLLVRPGDEAGSVMASGGRP